MSDVLVFEVHLPDGADVDAAEAFLRDTYLPAVRMTPTRVGQVEELRLWRGLAQTHALTSTLLLEVRYSGMASLRPRVDDEEVQDQFEELGADLRRLGAYRLAGQHPAAQASPAEAGDATT